MVNPKTRTETLAAIADDLDAACERGDTAQACGEAAESIRSVASDANEALAALDQAVGAMESAGNSAFDFSRYIEIGRAALARVAR